MEKDMRKKPGGNGANGSIHPRISSNRGQKIKPQFFSVSIVLKLWLIEFSEL